MVYKQAKMPKSINYLKLRTNLRLSIQRLKLLEKKKGKANEQFFAGLAMHVQGMTRKGVPRSPKESKGVPRSLRES